MIDGPDYCLNQSLGGPITYPFDSDGDGMADTCSLSTTRRAAAARQQALENLANRNPQAYDPLFAQACDTGPQTLGEPEAEATDECAPHQETQQTQSTAQTQTPAQIQTSSRQTQTSQQQTRTTQDTGNQDTGNGNGDDTVDNTPLDLSQMSPPVLTLQSLGSYKKAQTTLIRPATFHPDCTGDTMHNYGYKDGYGPDKKPYVEYECTEDDAVLEEVYVNSYASIDLSWSIVVGADRYRVQWRVRPADRDSSWPSLDSEPMESYAQHLKEGDDPRDPRLYPTSALVTSESYEIFNLDPGVTYQVRVRGENDAGVGQWSKALTATTPSGVVCCG